MKILVLCARVPYPLTNGESLRIFNYARHLAPRHELDLVCVGDPEAVDPAVHQVFRRIEVFVPPEKDATRRGWVRRTLDAFRVDALLKRYPNVEAHLADVVLSRDYDVIWTSTDLARCVPDGIRVPVLTDVCDDGVLLLKRELARTRGGIQWLRVWKRLLLAREFERRYFAPTDACLFVSDEDAQTFQALAPGSRAEVIPNGVDAEYFEPRTGVEDPATLIFEGSMDFAPNADAAVYLCRDLLPLIRARRPDVRVLIVGRDPTPEVRALASDIVTVTGRVDDIRPYLTRGTVFVCPLRMGAGIKNKILQAWSMGRAVVATPVSLGGLDFAEGTNLLVGRDLLGLADAVMRLLDDPELRRKIGARARETVLNAYRWEARSRQFEQLLGSLVAPYGVRRSKSTEATADARDAGLRRLLMVALQFPPYGISTGRLRTIGFVRYLPSYGWVPIVVTARESAFSDRDPKTMADIPRGARVLRAMGGDLARILSIKGVYPNWMATPDRWNTWAFGAAVAATKAAKRYRVDALWATFPVPSALLAALLVRWLTRLPLIADLRDPMVYEAWPAEAWQRFVYGWLERRVVRGAASVVLTTPRACDMYRKRYPELPAERFCEIPNGIEMDEAQKLSAQEKPASLDGPIVLLHSGLMEIPDRDPQAFFKALRLLGDRGLLPQRPLKVVLRASGREGHFRAAVDAMGLGALVTMEPRLPHDEALAELSSAAGLLLFQGQACNRQIPAKAYEYLASRRPILGLMDPEGDTHALVHGRWDVPYCADMADAEAIVSMLVRFFRDLEAGAPYVPPASLMPNYSRQAQAFQLAQLLDKVCAGDVSSRSRLVESIGLAAAPSDR